VLAQRIASGDGASRLAGDEGELGAMPVMQPLDRAASQEDVDQGRAVFALDGEVVAFGARLMDLPAQAQWRREKGDPIAGYIWQFEEHSSTAGRSRWVGFVSRDGVQKLPADEVTLAMDEQWAQLEPGLAVRMVGPQQDVAEQRLFAPA